MLLSSRSLNQHNQQQLRTEPWRTQNLDHNSAVSTFAVEELFHQTGQQPIQTTIAKQQLGLTPRQQIPEHITSPSLSAAPSPPLVSEEDLLAGFSQLPDLMPSDPWSLASPYTPKSLGRMPHQRESSLSSLGSTGPASPFNHAVSNPHIAVSDPASDGFGDMPGHDGGNSYYQLAKAAGSNGGLFSGYQSLGQMDHPEMGYPAAIAVQRPRTDRMNFLPTPDFGNSFNRSHPASVASSTVGGDSPATPTLGEPLEEDKRRNRITLAEPPKLDRTMTDIYSDELYNPSFTITSASPSHHQQLAASAGNDLFAQRLSAANSQHLSASQSPTSSTSRDRSPFRHGSPHAPTGHDFGSLGSSRLRFNSAHRIREQDKAAQDAIIIKQHMSKSESDTPKTISPKDAVLDFSGPDSDSVFPSLFPSQETASDFGSDGHVAKAGVPVDHLAIFPQQHQLQSHGGYPYHAQQQVHSNIHIPQQYPFVSHHQRSPPTLSTGASTGSSTGTPVQTTKPPGSAADGGTYTCTYHGCTLRFETPVLLQKHKREGHRQSHVLGSANTRPSEDGNPVSGTFMSTQAGPHRCDRINPSTGKPCSTIFSRPYDLTRHEDTIHNARKQKVRCNLCTEEKTFSRADALTRHYRVCHPDMELPGKYRRRANHG